MAQRKSPTESGDVIHAVLDTNIFSYAFRRDSRAYRYESTINRLERGFVSFATVEELLRWGLTRSWGARRIQSLETQLSTFVVVQSDHALCHRCAMVLHEAKDKGRPMSFNDGWIAATALELDCPLVTHNARDFEVLDNLTLIT